MLPNYKSPFMEWKGKVFSFIRQLPRVYYFFKYRRLHTKLANLLNHCLEKAAALNASIWRFLCPLKNVYFGLKMTLIKALVV